jgi:Cytochrome P460
MRFGVFLILGILVLAASHLLSEAFTPAAHHAVPKVAPVKEIAGYRNWQKVNPEPQIMHARTAQLCAPILPVRANVDGPTNPHKEKYISVYVNEIGRSAMMEKLKPSFPKGSVIVKEKLPEISSQNPELLTVMIKRSKGFNPVTGDWEYMVVDGTGTKVEARGKLENCQGCHLAQPQTDFIFRTYLSADARNKLH